jgi:hypothetical protein
VVAYDEIAPGTDIESIGTVTLSPSEAETISAGT